MNVSDEVIRAAFEKWVSSCEVRSIFLTLEIHEDGEYLNNQTLDSWSAFRAAFSIAIPDGWKIVPVEATAGMAFAGSDAVNFSVMTDNARVIYDAMLNTAPQPDYTK